MPIFGVHAFVWNGDWSNDIAPETIRKSAEAGFDLIEIPLLRPSELDSGLIRLLPAKYRIRAAASLALPKQLHLPFHPKKALDFLKAAIDKTAEIGSESLSGCQYCNLGTLTGKPPTEAERETLVKVFRELAQYARQRNVRIGIEPVNRYVTYLLNVASDVVDLIKTIGADNMFVHLDTYHMNIEEHGFSAGIKDCDGLCGYIHLSESDRGFPGEGNVDWDDVFVGLKAINFKGPLVLEAFADINPDLAAATCLWRPRTYSADELATKGLSFLRARAQAIGLA